MFADMYAYNLSTYMSISYISVLMFACFYNFETKNIFKGKDV